MNYHRGTYGLMRWKGEKKECAWEVWYGWEGNGCWLRGDWESDIRITDIRKGYELGDETD